MPSSFICESWQEEEDATADPSAGRADATTTQRTPTARSGEQTMHVPGTARSRFSCDHIYLIHISQVAGPFPEKGMKVASQVPKMEAKGEEEDTEREKSKVKLQYKVMNACLLQLEGTQ